jgi:hypothetical protein
MSQTLFVQFLHPGGEHLPMGPTMPWNIGPHRRKFIRQQGSAIRGNERFDGELLFWGEWEAQSRVIAIPDPIHRGPTWIHEPFYRLPESSDWRQNTDPCVFGGFRYTCCQQHFKGRPSTLQKLAPGSIILFGARVAGEFVLDTLIVVRDEGIEHDVGNYRRALDDKVPVGYFHVTLVPWYSDPVSPCRLYQGVTATKPMNGTFSFFPAVPTSSGARGFARPAIVLPGLVSSSQSQGRKFTALASEELADSWRAVVRQVEDEGLWLGISASFPMLEH